MKSFKKILIGLFLFLVSINTYATTLSTSTSLDVLYINVFHNGKWSGWNNHADITEGDKVWFQIHSYANGGNVKGLVSKLQNIDKVSYPKNAVREITSFIDADNTARINDSVRLTFKSNVKLDFAGYKWATKLKGPTPEANEHIKQLPFGQGGIKALSSLGVKLGDLAKDHRSNLLLFFSTGGYKPPINGKCSQQKNKCLNGKYIDIKDDSKYYKWRCAGLYNGINENCFLEKVPKDAICSSYVNKCKAGYFTDIKNDSKFYIWKCNGLNSGQSLECKAEKKPINGKCGSTLNKCSKGSFTDTKDTYEKKKWECRGLYGGSNINCSIQKMCPCTLEKKVSSDVDGAVGLNNDIECNQNNFNPDNQDLLNENKNLKIELNKINQRNNPQDSGKTWYWLLGLIYTFIVIAITTLISRRRK